MLKACRKKFRCTILHLSEGSVTVLETRDQTNSNVLLISGISVKYLQKILLIPTKSKQQPDFKHSILITHLTDEIIQKVVKVAIYQFEVNLQIKSGFLVN